MKIYKIVKSNGIYTTILPPLHSSESDVLFIKGNKKNIKRQIKEWKNMVKFFNKELK